MKPLSARWMLGVFLLLMLLSPWLLPPFYLTLLNYIGLYALVPLADHLIPEHVYDLQEQLKLVNG